MALWFGNLCSFLYLLFLVLVFSLCSGFPECFGLGAFCIFHFSLTIVSLFSMESGVHKLSPTIREKTLKKLGGKELFSIWSLRIHIVYRRRVFVRQFKNWNEFSCFSWMISWNFFFIIYHFKGGLSKTRQTTSYKLIPSKVAPWRIVIPFRVSVRLPQSKHWTGGFLLMCPTLVPDLPVLLQKKKNCWWKSYKHQWRWGYKIR